MFNNNNKKKIDLDSVEKMARPINKSIKYTRVADFSKFLKGCSALLFCEQVQRQLLVSDL